MFGTFDGAAATFQRISRGTVTHRRDELRTFSTMWFIRDGRRLLFPASLLLTTLGWAMPAVGQICNNPASCIEVHPTPGCNSVECCTTVCSIDPTCCGLGGWDAACVVNANQFCEGYPGAAASGSCYEAQDNPNCDSATCCAAVCAFDAFCCSVLWDFTCAQLAGFACPGIPGECGSPTAGSCYAPHATGACDELTCCNAVCAVDPSCCASAWDSICVIVAEKVCTVVCKPVTDPGADAEIESCGSRSNDPCYVATGGTAETILPGLQLIGTLGTFEPSSPADVDAFLVDIPDSDGDGLAKVSLTFSSSPNAWAALLPTQPCAPMSSALLEVSSELCVDAESFSQCIPAGQYLVVVSGGDFPQFGGGIDCNFRSTYSITVNVAQSCGNPCSPSAGSCFAARPGRGCSDIACCASVCAADIFCCDEGWDASCVAIAGNLCLSGPPLNDSCADAVGLVTGPQLFNTLRSGLEIGQSSKACSGATFARDVWYRWTGDRDGAVEISTCSPWFDTILAVYTGGCAAPVAVNCNDNAPLCGGIGSRVTFNAACGVEYLVRVGPRVGNGGEATITLASAAPECLACVGDIDGDGAVGAPARAVMLNAWGSPKADLNGDGTTDAQDLAALLSGWGPCE
jgi:hypothetical protein